MLDAEIFIGDFIHVHGVGRHNAVITKGIVTGKDYEYPETIIEYKEHDTGTAKWCWLPQVYCVTR